MSETPVEIVSRSVEETMRIGARLGANLSDGQVIALVGQLGTGKTHLIKGLARGLGVAQAQSLTSPTFTLINEYTGRLAFYYVDAYRLKDTRELEALGFEEICESGAVVAVEWADRVWDAVMPYKPIGIHLNHYGSDQRLIRLEQLPEGVANRLLSEEGNR